MIWVNIDIPTKKYTIHGNPTCRYIKNKRETDYKGADRLKRDGGWLFFDNLRDAEEFYLAKYDSFKLIEHCETTSNMNQTTNGKGNMNTEGIPFNSAMDHYQRILGYPMKKGNVDNIPRILRILYYSTISIVLIGSIMALYAIMFKG